MMTTEIFCSAIVNDICAMLEWTLQVGAHHGVIDDDDGIGSAFLDVCSYLCKVDDFEKRISWAL